MTWAILDTPILFSFEHDFALVKPGPGVDGKGILMPEQASRQQQFVDWSEQLPEKQTPSWLGLPNNAEKLLLTTEGKCDTSSWKFTRWNVQFY